MSSDLRHLPAVEKALQALTSEDTYPLPRPIVTAIVRDEIASLRDKIQAGLAVDPDTAMSAIRAAIDVVRTSRIRPVLNGTGVIIHTNLGRAPLGTATFEALRETATGYNNLELDLLSGERGKRGLFLERLLAQLADAPSATVVNNCASALILILKHFTVGKAKEVVISRGELVEIGGGFRVPEILEASGATLKEVGATNKTHLADYEKAISENTALILKVHRSNFYMGGFVDSPETEELVALGKKRNIPVVEDLGSGAVLDTASLAPIDHEPTPSEVLAKGVDLVCVSGDKLLGGPQAGIIAGNADLVAALKKNPFFRALRCDRLVLTALQETATAYLAGEAPEKIPVVQTLSATLDSLRARAEPIIKNLTRDGANPNYEIKIGTGESRLGGGTMPTSAIPSITLDLHPTEKISAKQLAQSLRLGDPAVIPYITENAVKIDLRTILPHQDISLTKALAAVRFS